MLVGQYHQLMLANVKLWFYRTYHLPLNKDAWRNGRKLNWNCEDKRKCFFERLETSFFFAASWKESARCQMYGWSIYTLCRLFSGKPALMSPRSRLLRTLLAPQKEIRALRKTCKMVMKDWGGVKYQKRDLMVSFHRLLSLLCSTIQLTFPSTRVSHFLDCKKKKINLSAGAPIIFFSSISKIFQISST